MNKDQVPEITGLAIVQYEDKSMGGNEIVRYRKVWRRNEKNKRTSE
jgi:hypothetical protein